MDLTTHLTLLLLGLAAANGQFKHSKRRPHGQFKFSFPQPPKIFAQTPPPATQPPPPTASIEVQKAEVHSEEFLPDRELQTPFAGNVHFQSFGPDPEFREEPQPRASFRQIGTTTPRSREQATPIPIIRLEKQQSLDGSYKSNYETGNDIHAEETGFVKNQGKGEDQETLVQFGSYSYRDPDGQLVEVSYTADEGGFRATGSHLPTPPPVPPEVQRGLDIIFESIKREAEREAKKKKQKRVVEPENYPVRFNEDTENQARAPTARPQPRP